MSKSGLREIVVTIAGALVISFIFRTGAYATYFIPSESMVPTLEVGDRLAVSKFPYGWGRYSVPGVVLPKATESRLMAALPARGDVAVFQHTRDDLVMIKRVIGLPGDRVAVRSGRLILNGKMVPRRFNRDYRYREHEGGVIQVREFTETLPGGRSHTIIERSDREFADNTREFKVPEGHLFMMGDNRDNSSDSRFDRLGFVPVANLVGRADAILFSLKKCASEPGVTCPGSRALSSIK